MGWWATQITELLQRVERRGALLREERAVIDAAIERADRHAEILRAVRRMDRREPRRE